jgi:hypothetical protein
MSKIYCPHCGSKNEYLLKKPDKCKSCGKPLSKISNISKSSVVRDKIPVDRKTNILNQDLDSDDFSDSFEVPIVNSLDYEIDYSMNNVFKGSDILNMSEEDLKESKKTIKKARGTRKRKTNLRGKKRAD